MDHGWLQRFAATSNRGNAVPELLGTDNALPPCLGVVFAPGQFLH